MDCQSVIENPQLLVLSESLNFAPVPMKILIPYIIASVENGLKNTTANQVSNIREGHKPPNEGLSSMKQYEVSTVRQLKQDNKLAVVQADKGQATVVMDRMEYEDKMKAGSTTLIYGLPKLYKPGVPFHPIVSFGSSPN